jgi:Holliday junction resolvase-like predicted endonuclease
VREVRILRLDTIVPHGFEFASASVALRPPRIAIMVADDENWREWAMSALSIASGYWGGGGFILIPFDIRTSRPSPGFAEIVRAYDPDHVVSLDLPLSTVERWYPGSVARGSGLSEADRQATIARDHGHDHLRESDVARAEVVTWCSPMRSVRFRDDHPKRQLETVTKLRARNSDNSRFPRGFAPAPPPSDPLRARLAASPTWRSDFGLMAAMRVGVAQTESATGPRPEPTVDDLGWLIRSVDDAPTSIIWNSTAIATQSSAGLEPWILADQRLIQVSNSYIEDRAAIVIGDTGTDFALAVAYDRIIGNSAWLPRPIVDNDDTFRRNIQPATWMRTTDLEGDGSHMAVTSMSESPEYLEEVAKRIAESTLPRGLQFGRASREETVRVGPAIVSGGYLEYVVDEHVGVSMPIPVRVMEDGTTEALSGLEAPVPSELIYPLNSGWVPYWYVEVTRIDDKTPRARDLPAHALVVDRGPLSSVNLRANRESVTIDPHSMGLVMAGSFLPGRLGRPQLRELSMTAWIEAMAEPEGLGVRLSQPGRQAELIRRRLGSRDALLDLMSPENVKMLRAFIPLSRKPSSAEREANEDIVVLDVDPYLTFEAIAALLPGGASAAVAMIDRLTSSRLLRRGLILGCAECGRPSFIDADRLGQNYECPQCAASNILGSERWRKGEEPRWFYDLYTVFRELLDSDGDVVLLAAASLRGSSRSYIDAPELEFYDRETGERIAEIDVIASVNREVVLVEAKSNGKYKGKADREEHARKMLRIAKALKADQVVFATTNEEWNATDIKHFKVEGATVEPFAVMVKTLTRLGAISESPRQTLVPVAKAAPIDITDEQEVLGEEQPTTVPELPSTKRSRDQGQ